jgi:isoquinoline 1-oxidoreductase beta subunit
MVSYELAGADPRFGDQLTGGSTSVRRLWAPLRHAGAEARARLVAAAAKRWGVAVESCRAEKGNVVHAATGKRLGYGALVEEAAKIEVRDAPLKDDKKLGLLGTRVARLDVPAKVDGTAQFGLDVKLPGLLGAVVARCPVSVAR